MRSGGSRAALAVMAVCGLLGLAACATFQRSPGVPGTVVDSRPLEEPVRSAFTFREAKLPPGFPPPGPVGVVIFKEYPAYRMAQVNAAAIGQAGNQDAMFMPLFNHIKRNEIAMTAPVEMGYSSADGGEGEAKEDGPQRRAESMAFLYGDSALGTPGPDPSDPRIEVKDVAPVNVLSIGLRGGYTDEHFEEGLDKIIAWMAEHPDRYRVAGAPRYLGYNSPFVPRFLRYSEVQVPVEPVR